MKSEVAREMDDFGDHETFPTMETRNFSHETFHFSRFHGKSYMIVTRATSLWHAHSLLNVTRLIPSFVFLTRTSGVTLSQLGNRGEAYV